MNAIRYGAQQEQEWDEPEGPVLVPGRPRRRLWSPATAVLLALLAGAICFYAGIRVEKAQMNGSSTGTPASALAARFSAAGGLRAAARGSGAGGGTAGAAGSAPGAGFGRFAGGAGGGNSSFGTVSSVAGHTLYVTDATGNTVKVTLSSATDLTKSLGVSVKSLHPGDTVIVQGVKGSNGTIAAASVSDNGNRGGGAGGSGSGSGSGGASSSTSALNSLFGSGG